MEGAVLRGGRLAVRLAGNMASAISQPSTIVSWSPPLHFLTMTRCGGAVSAQGALTVTRKAVTVTQKAVTVTRGGLLKRLVAAARWAPRTTLAGVVVAGLGGGLVRLSCRTLTISPDLSSTVLARGNEEKRKSLRQDVLAILRSVVSTLEIIFRGLILSLIFVPCVLTAPVIVTNKGFSLWLDLLLHQCELAGPVIIKLVQWASTRRDIFPELVCDKFSRVQRNTQPHDWSHTVGVLQDCYGEDFRTLFVELNPNPVGSGCCAQVYRGRVREAGEEVEVAVKVLHPGLAKHLQQDMAVMASLARWLTRLFPSLTWLSLETAVQEFGQLMTGQVDLSKEAENLETFGRNFQDNERVSFPRPLHSLCGQEVLVETWVEGTSILSYIRNDTPEWFREELAKLGVDMLLKMVFTDNLWHGDLHPGNIIVTKTQQGPALSVIDAGITGCLSQQDRVNLVETFLAIVKGDGYRVGALFLDRSHHNCRDKNKFCEEIEQLVMTARGTQLTLNRVDIGELLKDLFSILTRHQVRLDASFSSVVLAVMVLEGLGRTLHPHLDLVARAVPHIAKS